MFGNFGGTNPFTSPLSRYRRIFLDRIARTTYVGAVYCYRPSAVVCRSVGRSVTLLSPAKTAAPIEMPFGLWA